jgi:hypothetical protein
MGRESEFVSQIFALHDATFSPMRESPCPKALNARCTVFVLREIPVCHAETDRWNFAQARMMRSGERKRRRFVVFQSTLRFLLNDLLH